MKEQDFNSTVNSLDAEYLNGNISENMYKVCNHLTSKGYPTVSSCSGHGGPMAYIDFHTSVSLNRLESLFADNSGIFVLAVRTGNADFVFRRIKFVYNDENINYLLSK